jgi:hypothetical protein
MKRNRWKDWWYEHGFKIVSYRELRLRSQQHDEAMLRVRKECSAANKAERDALTHFIHEATRLRVSFGYDGVIILNIGISKQMLDWMLPGDMNKSPHYLAHELAQTFEGELARLNLARVYSVMAYSDGNGNWRYGDQNGRG